MTDLEIREEIARFVEGDLKARDLEDWLEDAAWDLSEDPARTLAATALRLLAEYSNGDWADWELREQLGAVSRVYWFEQAPKNARWSGSTSGVIRHAQPSAGADRWRVAGSV